MRIQRPRFANLPVRAGLPPRSAWEVYGAADQVGSLNSIDPDRVRHAAGLVTKGSVFSLNWNVELPNPALFGRQVLSHRILDLDPVGTEDVYDSFYPQASSQWDALAHIRHPVHGFYNGGTREEITGKSGSRNGIDHWASRGIAGRFVLADVERWRASVGLPINNGESVPITVADIDECLSSQGVRLIGGDILLIRFGWIAWYEGTDSAKREELASTDFFPAPGLANESSTAEWLWDNEVAAVAADNPALEVMPFDESNEEGYLHYRLIPLLGLAVGELFDLDALADDCSQDGVFEGLLTSAPINKAGGSGSPANALALK